jgi:hypothetical protein
MRGAPGCRMTNAQSSTHGSAGLSISIRVRAEADRSEAVDAAPPSDEGPAGFATEPRNDRSEICLQFMIV